MTKEMFSIHNHTDVSNYRLRDAINTPEKLIDYAMELGLPGIAITDHETLSSHIKASRYVEDKDFKLGFGNEIYLVDKETIYHARENNEKTQFHHFLLLAKNKKGYEFLKRQSSKAWQNNFYFRGMERVPTYYDELEELMKDYKGDVIASSACLGGPIPQAILKYHETRDSEDKQEIMKLVKWCVKVFGKDDFYLELQPSKNEEQLIVNKVLLQLGKQLDIKCIVTTDAHYLNKEQAMAHKIYLQSSQGDREVESFYSTTYVMNREELLEYFDEDVLDELIENTHLIMDKIEPITFKQQTQVPDIDIPLYQPNRIFEEYYDKYEYINKYAHSGREMDRYYLHLLGEGFIKRGQEFNEENLERINVELEQLWIISEKLGQPLSSYFVLTQDVINMMWEVSLVGVSRGSASCYYTNYLLDIVQINPITYNLPYWRFLSKERATLPDIDIDSEASKREEIMELAKERYGHDKILNSCTFTTEGPKSTVITACRGIGLSVDEQHNIANLIPQDGAQLWSVSDCFFGNEKEGRKPVTKFIQKVNEHENLKETMLAIEGIISGRSQHASSVIFYPRSFLDENAMMKTTKGLEVTQFNADDGEYAGELKLDFLSISALGRIREAMELLIKDGKIKWQGNLKDTYDKYLHPDVLDIESKGMFKMLSDGDIFDAFQMSSLVARTAMSKIKPETFDEVAITNTLIRLQTDGEQPVDKFVRYKKDISQWYEDMNKYGLNEEQVKLMERHLLSRTGICDTQEIIMEIIMDKDIGDSSLEFANKYRKAIAKKNPVAIEECENIFREQIESKGHHVDFANYIIDEQIGLSRKYSFSLPHVAGYTLILFIEMNIAYVYGLEYWKTACLTINSGLEGDVSKGADFGEVSTAVNSMKEDILPPDINESQLKFVAKNGKVLYALKPIIGLDVNTLDAIIENRPFSSLEDFYTRMVDNKSKKPIEDILLKMSNITSISPKKTITLVKAGAFDSISDVDRRYTMANLVKLIIPQKEKVTMTQLPYVRHILPNEFSDKLDLFDFRNRIEGRNKEQMNKDIEKIFISKYSKEVEFDFVNGELKIDMKSWKKFYDKSMKPLKEELKKPLYAEEFTRQKRKEYWKENCSGSVAEWEMETILFNTNEYAIDLDQVKERYDISDFSELKSNPVKSYNKRGFPNFEISAIVGVVVDWNNLKKYISVLTPNDGVVIVKLPRNKYSYYSQKLEGDSSWYERGTKLILLGYKKGNHFQVKGDYIYKNPVIKIHGHRKYSYQNKKLEQ